MTAPSALKTVFVIVATSASGAGEEQFTQRFDRNPIDLRSLKYIGSNAQEAITQSDGGLIITLSGDKPKGGQPPGVATRCKVEGDSFRELRQAEFGSEPLSTVQLFGTTGGSRQPVRVRFTHLSVRADHLPIGLPVKQETFVWSTWAVFGTTGVLVLIAAYVWSKRRSVRMRPA